MRVFGFGRKSPAQSAGFGRKGLGDTSAVRPANRIFGQRERGSGDNSPFQRYVGELDSEKDLQRAYSHQLYSASRAMEALSPEERGELLADLAERPGVYGGAMDGSVAEKAAYSAFWNIWKHEIEVRKEHLGALLSHMLDNPGYRKEAYLDEQFGKLLRQVESAIKQGAYLSSGDCEAIAVMAADMRNGQRRYRKAETKKMIARAEKLEKLAGVEVSATEFLMQRCEGAENPFAIVDEPRPNAQFWADLLAEVASALGEIRLATKGSSKPEWARNAAIFTEAWPACGELQPSFEAWKASKQPVPALVQHNGKRNGWADPEAYRRLPEMIAAAQSHSRYNWQSNQIPGLDVLADLENPDWTSLVEHMITQRRATKATKKWQKEALALCDPLGIEVVEKRLHEWLALFHTPALGRHGYTDVCNGERFAAAFDRLETAHPDWPARHALEIPALGRAVAMAIASGAAKDICSDFHAQLVRLDDHAYKNKSATTGVLHMLAPAYKGGTYDTLAKWMRLSVENEEFLRGALWLVALMLDRARAIEALERTAQSASTYTWTGDDGMRSKIIANAAIATLIDMGGNDIDPAVLRLSKVVEHQTMRAPLLVHLNLGE